MTAATQPPKAAKNSAHVLSVSDLTAQIKTSLEGSFPNVWVVGEVSDFARPQSGHCYFTLKDQSAQIRAVMWRSAAGRLPFTLEDGLEILCRGSIDVYAPRGSYQIVVQEAQPKGAGALELALRRLQKKLAAEGLFDQSRKRPLPSFPRRIALVTSPTGAAVRDFLEVLRDRWQGAHVLVIPARVQGAGAAAEIVSGIRAANRIRPAIDVLVVARGGGSLEDLWTFNDESVVRAIAASHIPTISAIGHEIDVTLSDLVADVRALTPSDAAQRILPVARDVAAALGTFSERMRHAVRRQLETCVALVKALAARRSFRQPHDQVIQLTRRLDELSERSGRAVQAIHRDAASQLTTLAGKLESLSPVAVLKRGFSLTQHAADGRLVRTADQLSVGDRIRTRFARGTAESVVQQIEVDPGGQ